MREAWFSVAWVRSCVGSWGCAFGIATLASLVASCADAPIAPLGSTDRTDRGDRSDGAEPDGGASSNGDAGGPVDSGDRRSAIIGLYTQPTDPTPDTTLVWASFLQRAEDQPPCTQEEIGPCVLTACPGGNPVQSGSAGDIRISTPLTTVDLAYDPQGIYRNYRSDEVLWAPGDRIDVSASGGDVPAFAASLRGPALAKLTAPDLAPGGGTNAVVIDPSVDFSLAWEPGSEGEIVQVQLGSAEGSLLCDVPLSAGTAVVPAGALKRLVDFREIYLSAAVLTRTTVVTGVWSVRISAIAPVVDRNERLAVWGVYWEQ